MEGTEMKRCRKSKVKSNSQQDQYNTKTIHLTHILTTHINSRQGMKLLLDAWWPGGSEGNFNLEGSTSASSSTCDGGNEKKGSRLHMEFDLRLAGRIYSESVRRGMRRGGRAHTHTTLPLKY